MRKQRVNVADIYVDTRNRRGIDQDVVRSIAASIEKIGLQNPISIYFRDGVEIDGEVFDSVAVLVAGAHRREALLSLGKKHETIEAVVFDDENTARLWEISENLHRKDLTALERDEQLAEWIERTERAQAEVSFQSETKPKPKAEGRPESGVRAAARELGINHVDAHRAVKVASLPPEAKEAARETGLDKNRTALLKAAKAETPEAAVATIREIAAAKAEPKPKPKSAVTALQAMGMIVADMEQPEPELTRIARDVIERAGADLPFWLEHLKPSIAAEVRRLM